MVCAVAAYKLVDIRILLYVLLIEDGNGQNEIEAPESIVNEQQESNEIEMVI